MGNPFVHLELSADDLGAAKKFYKSIFDWKFKDVPGMGGWSGIDVGKGVGGGMGGKQMPGQPTAWTPYVDVRDVKKTIAKAASAGATILVEYQEVPGMGALGIFVDPQGAAIGVWQAAKKAAAQKRGAAKRGAAKKAAAKKPAAGKAAPKKKAAEKKKKKKKK